MNRKMYLWIMLIIMTLFSIASYADEGLEDYPCGTVLDLNKNPEHEMVLGQSDGKYITANGTLKILVLFVQFSDDSNANSDWPPGSPPNFMNSFIDATTSQNSTNYANVTNYFDVMSLGNFQVIGDVRHVKLLNTQQWYVSNKPNRASIIREALEKLNNDDPTVNFADYDNWGSTAQHTHQNQPDGTVDMIFVIFRKVDLLPWSNWAGIADLGSGDSFSLDGKTIKMGYGLNAGSGVTIKYLGRNPANTLLTARHEFGHWLLGSHPYGSNPEYSAWGILGRWTYWGLTANAFEREQLGWINVIEVTDDLTNDFPIYDFLTATGVGYNAVKYNPPGANADEFYYFENHQKVHLTSDGKTYDDATLNADDKGIYVFHINGVYNGTSNVRCEPVDGFWDWDHTEDVPSIWGPELLPLFEKVSPDISGQIHRQKLTKNGGGRQWIFVQRDEDDNLVYGSLYKGEYFEGTFNSNTNTVFSPWSNPNSFRWNGTTGALPLSMEMVDQIGSTVYVHFYVTDPADASPSRPMNLTAIDPCYNCEVELQWEPNSEPDMISGGKYKIYRAEVWGTGDPTSFSLVETINAYNGSTPVTSWIDDESVTYNGIMWLHYYITALDNTQKESTPSNTDKVNARIPKSAIDEKQIIQEYHLAQNYPNPFNPTTTFAFALPEDAPVRLTVFDVNGKQITELLNEQLPAGRYEIPFDASELSSGVYLYRLAAGNTSKGSGQGFTQTRKMMLIK